MFPISEFKTQIAYYNTSQVLPISEEKKLTFTCIISCHFETHSRLLIVNKFQQSPTCSNNGKTNSNKREIKNVNTINISNTSKLS